MGNAASSSPDIIAVITNLGIFSLAVAAAIGGIWKGFKNIQAEANKPAAGDKVAQAVLIETATIILWSEATRDNTEATYRLRDDIRVLAHQLERLRDKL